MKDDAYRTPEAKFSVKLYQLIYGADVDIIELRKVKPTSEVWEDIILFLANGDVTEMEKVRGMNVLDVFKILNNKLSSIPKIKQKTNPVGFKLRGDNSTK